MGNPCGERKSGHPVKRKGLTERQKKMLFCVDNQLVKLFLG